jgi:hypothetical protein
MFRQKGEMSFFVESQNPGGQGPSMVVKNLFFEISLSMKFDEILVYSEISQNFAARIS